MFQKCCLSRFNLCTTLRVGLKLARATAHAAWLKQKEYLAELEEARGEIDRLNAELAAEKDANSVGGRGVRVEYYSFNPRACKASRFHILFLKFLKGVI